MKKQWLFSLGIIFTALQPYAQQTTLDSVIIKENRLRSTYGDQNRTIQILDSKQIAALPVKSVNELLAYAGGVDLRQRGPNGTQADISIDGSTFDQVLVLVNGVKMSDPQTGHNMMNIPIPLSAIDHIEVLRGSSAMIYGVNALAGAINIITKTPVSNEVTAQVYSGSNFKTDTANGDSYYSWGAQAAVALAGKNQGHLLSLAHDEGNGYRHNTAYNSYRLFYQNRFKINDKNLIEAMGGYISNDFGANGFYSSPADAESREKVQTVLGSIAYTYNPTKKWMIRPRISYRYNNDDYIFIKQNPAYYHNIHKTDVATGELQSTLQLGKGVLGAGAEYRQEYINSTNLGTRTRSNTGIYAEYSYKFNAKLNARVGVYGNYNTDYGWQAFPGIDAGYRFAKNWKVFANAGTGQRLPTYTDLYYKGPTNIGNATLQPELSEYAEGGLQYRIANLSVKGSYFYRHTSELIDWVRASATSPWQPRNFQSVNTQGITAYANCAISNSIGLSDNYNINLSANYTYLNPDVVIPTADISKYAIEALKHQLVVSANGLLFHKVQLAVNGRYQSRINGNDYTLLDARVAYLFKHWNVYADVNNILDTQYKEIGTISLPGRWYTLGLRLIITY